MTVTPQNELTVNLCAAFVSLNDTESVRAFLEDIASPGEKMSGEWRGRVHEGIARG